MRRPIQFLALAVALAAAGCGSPGATPTPAAPTASRSAGPGSAGPGSAGPGSASPGSSAIATPAISLGPDKTVWLCRPGIPKNPCAGSLDATAIDSNGKHTALPASPAADPPIDCFYIYPTVSSQKTVNANLTIDPVERTVAVAQAAQFSQVCRVYAPMYRQLTLAAIATPSKIKLTSALTAYSGVASAFAEYMARYNQGRGVVFIGHSQGAMLLIQLLKTEVDTKPETRRLLVSALLIGGNVMVPIGKSVGGDFANIPACSSNTQTGCVLAYSSFAATPPANAVFGRVATAINVFNKGSAATLQILCVNPAAPGGGTAALQPYLPNTGLADFVGAAALKPALTTTYATWPNQYSAHCVTSGGATWLQIDLTAGKLDLRSKLALVEPASWGLHLLDVNFAIGNLVDLVRSQGAAFH